MTRTSNLLEEVMRRIFRKLPIQRLRGGSFPLGAFLIFIQKKKMIMAVLPFGPINLKKKERKMDIINPPKSEFLSIKWKTKEVPS